MAKEGDTPKKKEQQQHVAARDASTQASTTAAKHKQDTESNESNNKKSTDREAKRAKVKAQAAQAQSIDVDADATPGPQLPNVNFAAPHQGPHGPHGPNTQMLITPGSNVSQPQTGPNVFQCYLQSYYTYIPGDVDPTDPSFEVMPLAPDETEPITPTEARTRLDEMHYVLTCIAIMKDKAQAKAISLNDAAPNVAWLGTMDRHVKNTLQRFGGSAATTNLYKHLEAMAKLALEALQGLGDPNTPVIGQGAGQGGGAGGGGDESSGGRVAGSADGTAGGGQD